MHNIYKVQTYESFLNMSKTGVTTKTTLNKCKQKNNKMLVKGIQGELPHRIVTHHAKDK
jgi:hypothetical protein